MSERRIAGLYCREVLAFLPDFLDGELPPDRKARVEEHLRGCDWCERFGGEYAEAVEALRRTLAEAPPVPDALRQRLRTRLDSERA